MLNSNKAVMLWLGMLPAEESSDVKQKIIKFLVAFCSFSWNFVTVVAHLTFFVRYRDTGLSNTLFSEIGVIGGSCPTYVAISGFLLRHKMVTIYDQLFDIYDSAKSNGLKNFMIETNETCEWMWKRYFLLMISSFLPFPIISVVSVLICWWMKNDMNVINFYHPSDFILPWNQSTYLGYCGEILFTAIESNAYLITNGAVLLLFISMCMFHQTFYEMFMHLIDKLNKCKRIRDAEATMGDIIRFRASVQDWFYESIEIYSQFVLIQLLFSTAFLTLAVFFFDSQIQQIDGSLVLVVIALCFGMGILLLYCFFGALATVSYEKMADALFESNWPDLPVALQKCFVVMIADMQKPIRYHGFGIANLDLNTFIKLIKTVGTYYMMLKTITSK